MPQIHVFLSDNLEEVSPERDAVNRALQQLRVNVFTPEFHRTSGTVDRAARAEHIARSDIFLGVYGRSYDPIISTGADRSAIEFDVNLAKSLSKPMLIYMKREDLPAGVARESEQQKFLQRVTADHVSATRLREYLAIEQLSSWAVQDVSELIAQLVHNRVQQVRPFNVPQRISHFLGREYEFELLKNAVLQGQAIVILNVHGMPGVGKTALAIHTGHELSPLIPDGVIWLNLENASAMDALVDIAVAYGQGREITQLSSMEARVLFVQRMLGLRRPLLMLDNALASEQVEPLVRACGGSQVIVTTRKRDLGALRDAFLIEVHPLSTAHAIGLFQQVLPDLVLSVVEESALRELAEAVGGLPLALRLLAERTRRGNWSMLDLLHRFRSTRLALVRFGRDRTKDTDLLVSFKLSVDELTPTEREVLAALAAQPARDATADAVGYAAEVDPAEDRLEDLNGLGLVQRLSGSRWGLHPLIRIYAEDRLVTWEHTSRASKYYLNLAEVAERYLYSDVQEEWFERLDAERANLRGLLDQLLTNGVAQRAVELAGALSWYWSVRGELQQGRVLLDRALATEPSAISVPRARALVGAAYLAGNQGDFASARRLAGEALDLYQKLGLREAEAACLVRIAYAHWGGGAYDMARSRAADGLRIAQEESDEGTVAAAMNVLGLVSAYEREYDEAASWYKQSLDIRRQRNDSWAVATTLSNLAEVERCRGDLQQAESLYQESRSIRRILRDAWSEPNMLNNLAELDRHGGEPRAAAGQYRLALVSATEMGNKVAMAISFAGLAGVAALVDQPVAAGLLFGASDRLLNETSARLGPANALENERLRATGRSQSPKDFEDGATRAEGMELEALIDFAMTHPLAPQPEGV